MNYEEIIEKLSKIALALREDNAPKCASACDNAADAIKTLLHKLDRVMSDVPKECRTCVRWDNRKGNPICYDCWTNGNRWEYRW